MQDYPFSEYRKLVTRIKRFTIEEVGYEYILRDLPVRAHSSTFRQTYSSK